MDGAAPVATEPGRQTLAWPRDEWISARQLDRLFGNAGPREIIVYHVGHLAEDRELSLRMIDYMGTGENHIRYVR